MLKDPSLTAENGHVNLFMAEEFEFNEKEKLSKKDQNLAYLTKTANLGEMFHKDNLPWYNNKNKQLSKFEKVQTNERDQRKQRETKHMLRIGKFRWSQFKIARNNPTKAFGQVLNIEWDPSISSKTPKYDSDSSGSRKEKKHKKHKSHKSSKKHKKDKKERKEKKKRDKKEKLKILKEQKLKELSALIDYQNMNKSS